MGKKLHTVPFITCKSGLFFRVRVYKLIRVPEDKLARSTLGVWLFNVQLLVGSLQQAHPVFRANDCRTIEEGSIPRYLLRKGARRDADRGFRRREQRRWSARK